MTNIIPARLTSITATAMAASAMAATAMAATPLPAFAQHHGHGSDHQAASSQHGPYAGMQTRPIKALSAQQIAGLKSGRGMGMAMPAELNGYPGPMHVLELATQLNLSDEQAERTRTLFAEMQAQAIAAGEEVIAAEAVLDNLFQEKRANNENVSAAVARAAQAHGKLRETHLRYHLAMMEILSADQVALYSTARGY